MAERPFSNFIVKSSPSRLLLAWADWRRLHYRSAQIASLKKFGSNSASNECTYTARLNKSYFSIPFGFMFLNNDHTPHHEFLCEILKKRHNFTLIFLLFCVPKCNFGVVGKACRPALLFSCCLLTWLENDTRSFQFNLFPLPYNSCSNFYLKRISGKVGRMELCNHTSIMTTKRCNGGILKSVVCPKLVPVLHVVSLNWCCSHL